MKQESTKEEVRKAIRKGCAKIAKQGTAAAPRRYLHVVTGAI